MRLLLGQRLARTQGALSVPGLKGRLRIHRDRWGIPTVVAENDHDAFFGLGFCHGQDRAFQLEVLLRVARGTLAELVGKAAVPVDRLSRRIGFYHSARKHWPQLGPELQGQVEAYTRGITAGNSLGLPARPHEFVLLGGRPTPWGPLDTVALVKVMSFSLASNWDVELARLKVLLEDGPDALLALDPSYDPDHPVTAPPGVKAGPACEYLLRDLALFTSVVQPGGASNNWAIAPWRTATGRPLLANDPHLEATLPSQWYLAHLRTPEWSLAGAFFVGGPGAFAGHNGHCAWGITAGLVDNTDLFREEIGPDGRSVREGDSWVPCPVREETIRVKGGQPIVERVLETPRGPIISPALEGGLESLSLRATWLDPWPIRGLLAAHRARNVDELRQLLADWPALSQNVVCADVSGAIGWQLTGMAPRRRSGSGTVPLPAWEPDVGWWPDPVPFEQMPHLVNPSQGFIATANTQPTPYDTEPFLGVDWIDGYRLMAINRALRSHSDWSVASCQDLQRQQRTMAWEEMRDPVLAIAESTPEVQQALELLRDWDGSLGLDSPAGTVYELFLAEMAKRVARAKAPRTWEWVVGKNPSVLTRHSFWTFRRASHLARLLRTQPDGWFPRSWQEEMAEVLNGVIRQLHQQFGPSPERWGWGQLRPLVMEHPLGKESKLLGRIFNLGPVPCGGDTDTISQASARPLDPLAPAAIIASMRAVIDVGDWSNSRFVLPAGQSGNPFSPHYSDLFALWQRGEGVPIAWTDQEIQETTVQTLELTPG
jgi:penicillin amidase